MLGGISAKFSSFRPRSELVRRAQIELLLRHTRFQTIAAPFFGLFLVLAFERPDYALSAWGWAVAFGAAYAARMVAFMGAQNDPERGMDRRLNIYLVGLAGSGLLWSVAPHAIAPAGTDAQLIAGIFVAFAVLVGVVGNFLYYSSAVVYFLTWILPALVSLGFVYTASFESLGWTYAGVVVMFLIYAYKCLEVINLPMGETLELNEALVHERDRAEASDRAKSDFLAMMSHELRTPLNAIMGFSEIIRDQIFGPDAHRQYVEQAACIREAGGLLSDLIGDLLELSALEARGRDLNIEEVEVSALIATATQLLQDTAAKRRIGLKTRVAPGLPFVPMDRRSAIQCLTNILGNAVKYSPVGADVLIEAEASVAFVLIHVRDRGPGIPEAELGTVTEAFRRGTGAQASLIQGVGLGLAIAENLMKQHNGNLEIISSLDEGTTVTLSFPIAAETVRGTVTGRQNAAIPDV